MDQIARERRSPRLHCPICPGGRKPGFELYAAYDRDMGMRNIVAPIRATHERPENTGKVAVIDFCPGGFDDLPDGGAPDGRCGRGLPYPGQNRAFARHIRPARPDAIFSPPGVTPLRPSRLIHPQMG